MFFLIRKQKKLRQQSQVIPAASLVARCRKVKIIRKALSSRSKGWLGRFVGVRQQSQAMPSASLMARCRAPKSENPLASPMGFLLFGGVGRDRTADTRIFSPLLYQLSYRTIPDTFQGRSGSLRSLPVSGQQI